MTVAISFIPPRFDEDEYDSSKMRALVNELERLHAEFIRSFDTVDTTGNEINDLSSVVTWANVPLANIPSLPASQITSGTFDDARIAASNVTQHQAALSILESQIVDADILARIGGNETITGTWIFGQDLEIAHATDPRLYIQDTDAGVDEKTWAIHHESNDSFGIRAHNDARSSSQLALEITRLAGVPGEVHFLVGGRFDDDLFLEFGNVQIAQMRYEPANTRFVLNTGGGNTLEFMVAATPNIIISDAPQQVDLIGDIRINADNTFAEYQSNIHDTVDFNTAFTGTTNWNITGVTAIQAGTVDADFDALTATSYGGIVEDNLVDRNATALINGAWTHTGNDFYTAGSIQLVDNVELRLGDGPDARLSWTGTVLTLRGVDINHIFELQDGFHLRLFGNNATSWADFHHDNTDLTTSFNTTTDWNITGITTIQAGTVDADFDVLTATSFNGVVLTTGGVATNFLDETGAYSVPLADGSVTGSFLYWDGASWSENAHLQQTGSDASFQLKNTSAGGGFRIDVNTSGTASFWNTDTSGVDEELYMQFNQNADVVTFHNGLIKTSSDTLGLIIHSTGNTDAEARQLAFDTQSGIRRGFIGHDSGSSTMRWENEIHGAFLVISGENTAGSARNYLLGDPDDFVQLYNPGAGQVSLKTLPAASGGAQVNNSLTGGGLERVLTIGDLFGTADEINDLTAAVTWADVPDANITVGSVTQHETALTILESQITDANVLARIAGTETITGPWTFTNIAGLRIEEDLPRFTMKDNNAAADEKVWRQTIEAGVLVGRAFNDAETSSNQWFRVERTGFVVDDIIFSAPVTATSYDGVVLTTGGVATNFLDETGAYSVPVGAEVNDLSSIVTWANVPNVNITAGSVTQHATALEGVMNHDDLLGFVTNEHLDWTLSVGTIHTGNYIENVPTALSTGTRTATTYGITSDGGADDILLLEATTTLAGLLGADKWDEIVANTVKVTNATHTGQVTGATVLSLAVAAITAQPASGALIGTDTFITNDGGVLSESTMDQLATFIGAANPEVNDLTASVTWANVPDANITAGSVTQHEAALTILESQITDSTILARLGASETVAADWKFDGQIIIKERATPPVGETAYGVLWVKNTVPNELWFTDDNSADHQISGGSDLVNDTSPQLGGSLASNGFDILMADGDKVIFGDAGDMQMFNNAGTATSTISNLLTNAILDFTFASSNKISFDGANSRIDIRDGWTLRLRDGTDLDWADFSHNGTDFLTVFEQTGDWLLTGITNLKIGGVSVATLNTNWSAADITSGTLAVLRGGTGVTTKTGTGSVVLSAAPALTGAATLGAVAIATTATNWATGDIVSGTFDDARIAAGNVTQHEAALTILESQITDADVLARLAANETVTGIWNFDNNVIIGEDKTFRIEGNLSTNWTEFDRDATVLDVVPSAAGHGFRLRTGQSLSVWDSTNMDHGTFSHTGVDFTLICANTTDFNIELITSIKSDGSLLIKEAAAAAVDAAAYGQYWVKSDVPNTPHFEDDTGATQQLDPSQSPMNTQNGSYTLVLGDKGKTITKVSGGAGETITIPANASVVFPIGTLICINNDGGGTLTVAITTDTLTWADDNSTGSRTLADGGMCVILKVTATAWKVAGDGIS